MDRGRCARMHDLSRNLGCLEERLDLQTVGWGGRGIRMRSVGKIRKRYRFPGGLVRKLDSPLRVLRRVEWGEVGRRIFRGFLEATENRREGGLGARITGDLSLENHRPRSSGAGEGTRPKGKPTSPSMNRPTGRPDRKGTKTRCAADPPINPADAPPTSHAKPQGFPCPKSHETTNSNSTPDPPRYHPKPMCRGAPKARMDVSGARQGSAGRRRMDVP